jgi:hypothetical protein
MSARSATLTVLFTFVSLDAAFAGDTATKVPAPLVHGDDVKTPAPPPSTELRPASAVPSGGSTPMGHKRFEDEHARSIERALASPTHRDIVDHSRMYWDQPGDGAIWARGRDWKAKFDAHGATFIPFLGSDAPRNYPLRLELVHATRGGTPLAIANAEPSLDGDDLSIEHGALREVFHATPDALEQTFVVSSLTGEGDLVLEIATASELAASADAAGGFRFANERGGVRYGRATAIDANGERLTLADELVNGSLVLRVPSSFLAHAALPLTIDPVMQTNSITNGAAIDLLPDIAADGVNLDYMVVYEEIYSSNDADVYSVSTDGFGAPTPGTTAYIDFTSDSWAIPKIAFNALHQTFLTVAQVIPSGGSAPYIRGRARSATSTFTYAQQTLNGAEQGDKFYVDVGGDPELTGPTYFFAAWTRNYAPNDWDIHARLIDFDGTPLGTSVIFLDDTTAFDWHPRVSKTDGRAPFFSQTWNVVWMREQHTQFGDYDEVWGSQVRWDGGIVNSTFDITSGFESSYPVASSPLDAGSASARPYAVAWFSGLQNDHDVTLARMQGTSVQTTENVNHIDGGDFTEDQTYPEVDTDGAHIVVAYLESYNHSTSDFDAYVSSMFSTPTQITLLEGHQNFDFTSLRTDTCRITGFFTTVLHNYPFFGLAWNRTASFDVSDGTVMAGMYALPGDFTTYCAGDGSYGNCPCTNNGGYFYSGCPNSVAQQGASIGVGGTNSVSDDTLYLNAVGMPSNATCLFFQGTAPTNPGTVLAAGLRCAGGTLIRLGSKVASNGSATYPQGSDLVVSVRGQVPAYGGYRYYQTWYRDPHGTCSAGTFNLTNGVSVLWLP